jgi:hypothetical protein
MIPSMIPLAGADGIMVVLSEGKPSPLTPLPQGEGNRGKMLVSDVFMLCLLTQHRTRRLGI